MFATVVIVAREILRHQRVTVRNTCRHLASRGRGVEAFITQLDSEDVTACDASRWSLDQPKLHRDSTAIRRSSEGERRGGKQSKEG